MKKLLKKNQVIITALVIMIAVAGYLNFTQDKITEVADNEVAKEETADGEKDDQLKETMSGKTEEEEVAFTDEEGEELYDLSAEDLGEDGTKVTDSGELAEKEEPGDAGEAVLVSNTIEADFFTSARLTREQTRAKNKETLMELAKDESLSEAQKQEALDEVIRMTEFAEKESAAEILLESKGFPEAVVSMSDDGVDVIVNATELSEQHIAQIEDIVKRKTGVKFEDIVINPVATE